jgi:circadian clock protein KaiA
MTSPVRLSPGFFCAFRRFTRLHNVKYCVGRRYISKQLTLRSTGHDYPCSCSSVGTTLHSKLSICTLLKTSTLAEALLQALRGTPHSLTQFESDDSFVDFIDKQRHSVDCLILEHYAGLPSLLTMLQQRSVLLPTIILNVGINGESPEADVAKAMATLESSPSPSRNHPYHQAALHLDLTQIGQLEQCIDQAIGKFLKLSPAAPSSNGDMPPDDEYLIADHPMVLMPQQRRLSEKLKERLGYLGVYYKRNPKNFLRNLPAPQRKAFLRQLKDDYRKIILEYFSPDVQDLNERIDNFVNMAFFADVSVSQIVEIHMGLMDEFAKHLKLEGRSEEILLDYRLTLIDAIAHLCEMYRRSIPRES